ncbi:hypothetical protein D3C76_1804670 [compost metagenome]
MAMSMGHSSSAYSLEVVYPSGSEMAAARMMACQPQNTKEASGPPNSLVWQVRCTT